jgi:hypothetical protein
VPGGCAITWERSAGPDKNGLAAPTAVDELVSVRCRLRGASRSASKIHPELQALASDVLNLGGVWDVGGPLKDLPRIGDRCHDVLRRNSGELCRQSHLGSVVLAAIQCAHASSGCRTWRPRRGSRGRATKQTYWAAHEVPVGNVPTAGDLGPEIICLPKTLLPRQSIP